MIITTTSTQSTRIINVYDKPFDIYWNVPTFQCRGKKVFFEELNAKYNIITNQNDSFKGDKMVIMYDPGNFPAILTDDETGYTILRNGGVPQAGNLTKHLEMFQRAVENDFLDVNYSGLAVIDFESWRPIYNQNWGSLIPYKDLSVDIEAELHPMWTLAELKREAERRFELEGRKYVEDTLRHARKLRPNAIWGYYAYPYCYNMQSPDYLPICSDAVVADNDRLNWMFDASQSLHPSLYFGESLTADQRRQLMEGRVYEAVRVKNQFGENKRIYPYFWFVYRDTRNFMSEEDLLNAFSIFKSYGTDGMIIWGSSSDVNTKQKCKDLYNYIDTVLGPAIVKFRRF